jgi:hypothetical protein
MDGQIEVADGGSVNQSAGDHDPACKCLGNEEYSYDEVHAKFPERNLFCEQKIENRDGVDQPGEAGDETVDPFDVENVFIFLQIHIGVNLFEFRGLLIPGEFLLPGLFANGRDRSANWIPLRDRKSRTREADKPAKDNKKRHNASKGEEPVPDTSIRDCSHHGAVMSLRQVVFSRNEVAGIIASGFLF